MRIAKGPIACCPSIVSGRAALPLFVSAFPLLRASTPASVKCLSTTIDKRQPHAQTTSVLVSRDKISGPPSPGHVAIDFEWFERNHKILLEMGVSVYNGQKYQDMHIIIKEQRHLRNGRFVPDNRYRFSFGASVVVSLEESRKLLWEWLKDSHGIIGHGMSGDKKVLSTLFSPAQLAALHEKSNYIDTQLLFRSAYPTSARSSLTHVLETLKIDYKLLHNAGNDARYTLMVYLKLKGLIQ